LYQPFSFFHKTVLHVAACNDAGNFSFYGEHEIEVSANSLTSGVYLYSLKMNNKIYKAKMLVVR